MRKILFLFLLGSLPFSLLAQKDSNYVDVGVNAFKLIRVGESSSSQSEWLNPYALHLEAGFGKVGLRIGLGFYKHSESELPSFSNGNTEFDDDTASTDFRIGMAIRSQVGERWSFKYGADAIFSKQSRTFNTTIQDVDGNLIENESELIESSTGIGFFLFPQFHITSKISLATELQMIYASTSSSDSVTSSNFPDFDSQIDKEGTTFFMRPPTALFLIVRF